MATEARPLAPAGNRRVVAIVAVAALAAAGAIVGATLLQTRGESTTVAGAVTTPQPGNPPLKLDFGLGTSAQTRALARAQALYNANHVAQAAAIFGRYHSLEAQIGSAYAAWGTNGLARMKSIASAHPASAAALLHLGTADYWAGQNADAAAEWEKTARLGADSPYGVAAEDLLHPTLNGHRQIPGLPYVVLDFGAPPGIGKLSPPQQLAALARAAAKPNARAKLLYGSALWGLERPLSAEKQFAAAAKLAPRDPVARTAAAVGLYTKADPVKAFSHLGPLTGVFPRAAVVRFHLGLLLLWSGQRHKAIAQLRLAAADGPSSAYAQDARRLLSRLPGTRSK